MYLPRSRANSSWHQPFVALRLPPPSPPFLAAAAFVTDKVGYRVGLDPVDLGDDEDVKQVVQQIVNVNRTPQDKCADPSRNMRAHTHRARHARMHACTTHSHTYAHKRARPLHTCAHACPHAACLLACP
jgi:hypothetical protein